MTKERRKDSDNTTLLVMYQGKFHDISPFAEKHPGGEAVLRQVAGSDITSYLNGENAVFDLSHKHSNAAYDILQRYSLDGEFKNDELVDSKDGNVWRVGELREKYWNWIHRPYDGTIRLFDSELLESLTRTKWWMIPGIWMPIVLYYAVTGILDYFEIYGMFGIPIGIGLFSLGFLSWTLMEYSIHRGVFHWKPNLQSSNQITLHFLLHGLHHKTPMDRDRLVFPPAAAALIIGPFCIFYRSILPFPIFCCYASGKLFGYICYDMIHYYIHFGTPKPKTSMHKKKIYHHNHHFKDTSTGFGISTMLWDYVFGTVADC